MKPIESLTGGKMSKPGKLIKGLKTPYTTEYDFFKSEIGGVLFNNRIECNEDKLSWLYRRYFRYFTKENFLRLVEEAFRNNISKDKKLTESFDEICNKARIKRAPDYIRNRCRMKNEGLNYKQNTPDNIIQWVDFLEKSETSTFNSFIERKDKEI